MSAVWLAHDDELDRPVAVKVLAPSADRGRFEREARAAAALSHPNICALYDYGEADGRPYMVLEYLPQGSLEERLRGGRPLPDDETLRIAVEIASGLAHAHERGLVHRDLKPANILFDGEGRAKIADFGIARMGGSGTLTEAGTVLGTASYISPEQAGGRPAGPASDVYSFGVILFRMLTGALPFHSTNAMELVRMHRDDSPPAVAERRADAPARLAGIVTASLAKDPAARPADGAAVLRELRAGEPVPPLAAGATAAEAAAAATQVLGTQALGGQALGPEARRRSRLGAGRSRALPVAALAALLLAAGAAAAVILTHGSSGGKAPPLVTRTSTARTPATKGATTSTASATTRPTTAQTTTARPTTAPATTGPATTARATTHPTTTARTTTAHTTTQPPTTAATTTATTSPTTTTAATTVATTTAAETTTAATTTDQGGTTTAP
jgi:serine/threonine-protein kinase